jgi:hypothetical protein
LASGRLRRRRRPGGVRSGRDPARLKRKHDPVEPDPEADPGRRLAAEQLDEPVVAAAPTEGPAAALRRRAGRTRTPCACSNRGRGRAWARADSRRRARRDAPDVGEVRCACVAQRSVILGASALSSCIVVPLESSRRSGFRSSGRARAAGPIDMLAVVRR